MTLPASGQISLLDIDGEFGLGTDLGTYRGVTWYTDAGGTGTFSNTNLAFSEFYSKRATSPVSPTTAYNSQYNSNTSGTSFALGASSLIIPANVTMRILVGFGSSAATSFSLSSTSFTSASSSWTSYTGQPNPMPMSLISESTLIGSRYYKVGWFVSPSFTISPPAGVTGVLGTIDLNFSASASNCGIVVYFLYDAANPTSLTNTYEGALNSALLSQTISTNASAKSTVLAIVNSSRGGQTFGWTNVTENADFSTRSGSDRISAGSTNLTTTGAYDVTVACTSTFQETAYSFIRIFG